MISFAYKLWNVVEIEGIDRNWRDLTRGDYGHRGGEFIHHFTCCHLHNHSLHCYHPGFSLIPPLYLYFLTLQHPINQITTFAQQVQVIVTGQGSHHLIRRCSCPCHCCVVVCFSSLATLCLMEWDSVILSPWWGWVLFTLEVHRCNIDCWRDRQCCSSGTVAFILRHVMESWHKLQIILRNNYFLDPTEDRSLYRIPDPMIIMLIVSLAVKAEINTPNWTHSPLRDVFVHFWSSQRVSNLPDAHFSVLYFVTDIEFCLVTTCSDSLVARS